MTRLLVLFHLLGVVIWVGGMAFAHFCLRPVAAAQLPPPQRLPLLAGVLGRFFRWVAVAVLLIWASGMVRFAQVGSAVPVRWQIMAGLGLAMTAIYMNIVMQWYPALRDAVAEQRWPDGGAAMDRIRRLVLVNLVLGVATIAIAILGV